MDFKIDRSCPGVGQAQFVGVTLGLAGDACSVSYDNPFDPNSVDGDTILADVPQLQQLFDDALAATFAQSAGTPWPTA